MFQDSLSQLRTGYRGLFLVVTIALCAMFLSEHYGAPVMLFALLIGMAFNFMSDDPRCKGGVEFSAKTLLRIGVALLGFRLSFSQLMELGAPALLTVVGLLVLTILFGVIASRVLRRGWRFGLLTGGSVAICGASAALALASVLPARKDGERDLLFTVIAVTTLSTVAMIVYPLLFDALDMSDLQIGFLLGATIHDVAQVVGAGYSVSQTAGDLATLVKLERVAMLPVVLFTVLMLTNRDANASAIRIPGFLVFFIIFLIMNSFGIVPDIVTALAQDVSRWCLIFAISALGVKTALQGMFALGPKHVILIVAETIFLLIAAVLSIQLLP